MKGIIIKSTGSWHHVRQEDGTITSCKIKGKFRIKGIRITNPIAVGDNVEFEIVEDGTGMIHKIDERKNYIIRKSTNLSKQAHIIATNIDQALLIATLSQPATSTAFIDRFLVSAEAYHIPVLIVFNKMDVYDKTLTQQMNELKKVYEKIGYGVEIISATKNINLDSIKAALQNKISVVAGHSGVGKSTLINAIEPSLNLRVDDISDYHQTGKHTTTNVEMHTLSFGGYLIDTPGIKGFGLIDLKKETFSHYFPEMRNLISQCQFNNCVHINEPHCAVKDAYEKKEIAPSRYQNYINMFNDDENTDVYRMNEYE